MVSSRGIRDWVDLESIQWPFNTIACLQSRQLTLILPYCGQLNSTPLTPLVSLSCQGIFSCFNDDSEFQSQSDQALSAPCNDSAVNAHQLPTADKLRRQASEFTDFDRSTFSSTQDKRLLEATVDQTINTDTFITHDLTTMSDVLGCPEAAAALYASLAEAAPTSSLASLQSLGHLDRQPTWGSTGADGNVAHIMGSEPPQQALLSGGSQAPKRGSLGENSPIRIATAAALHHQRMLSRSSFSMAQQPQVNASAAIPDQAQGRKVRYSESFHRPEAQLGPGSIAPVRFSMDGRRSDLGNLAHVVQLTLRGRTLAAAMADMKASREKPQSRASVPDRVRCV